MTLTTSTSPSVLERTVMPTDREHLNTRTRSATRHCWRGSRSGEGTDDRRHVEAHLAQCERCRQQLAEYESVAATLAYTAPAAEPPPRDGLAVDDRWVER